MEKREWIIGADGIPRIANVHFWHANSDPYPSNRIRVMREMGYRYDGASGCGNGAWYDFSPICDGARVYAASQEEALGVCRNTGNDVNEFRGND